MENLETIDLSATTVKEILDENRSSIQSKKDDRPILNITKEELSEIDISIYEDINELLNNNKKKKKKELTEEKKNLLNEYHLFFSTFQNR